MKKFLSILLALCMVVGMLTVGAAAAPYMSDANHVTPDSAGNNDTAGLEATGYDKGDEIGTADIPVYIEANTTEETINVYAISYDVSELTFVFSATETSIWNPETLKYELIETSSWDATSQDITVTNYSDLPVKVTPSNTAPIDAGVTVTLGAALELASAFDGDMDAAGTAKSGVISVTVAGKPVADHAAGTTLTTITLTVTDNRA